MSNSIVLKAFNKQFFEFLDDIVVIFHDNPHIKESMEMMINLKKANPTIIIKLWKKYIWEPYSNEINSGDINFFIEKDYTHDFSNLPNGKAVSEAIDATIREPMRLMNDANRSHCIRHIQVVSQLSSKYN